MRLKDGINTQLPTQIRAKFLQTINNVVDQMSQLTKLAYLNVHCKLMRILTTTNSNQIAIEKEFFNNNCNLDYFNKTFQGVREGGIDPSK